MSAVSMIGSTRREGVAETGSSKHVAPSVDFKAEEIEEFTPIYYQFQQGKIPMKDLPGILGGKFDRFKAFVKAMGETAYGISNSSGLPSKFSPEEVELFRPMFAQLAKKEKTLADFAKEFGLDTIEGKAIIRRFRIFANEYKEVLLLLKKQKEAQEKAKASDQKLDELRSELARLEAQRAKNRAEAKEAFFQDMLTSTFTGEEYKHLTLSQKRKLSDKIFDINDEANKEVLAAEERHKSEYASRIKE